MLTLVAHVHNERDRTCTGTGSTTGGEIRFAEDIDEYDRNKPIKKSAADSRPAKSRRTKR